MRLRVNEKFKFGVMSLSEIIGVEKMNMLIEGFEVSITQNEKEVIQQLPENYQEAIEIIEEDE